MSSLLDQSHSISRASNNVLSTHGNVPIPSLRSPTNELIEAAKVDFPKDEVVKALSPLDEEEGATAANINSVATMIFEMVASANARRINAHNRRFTSERELI